MNMKVLREKRMRKKAENVADNKNYGAQTTRDTQVP